MAPPTVLEPETIQSAQKRIHPQGVWRAAKHIERSAMVSRISKVPTRLGRHVRVADGAENENVQANEAQFQF